MTISLIRRGRRADATGGVTLVELLVTIMIIGILSSSVLFAMSVAQESARKARTQALIATLHSLLIERWETYLNRRYNFLDMVDETTKQATLNERLGASQLRLRWSRQFLKMDFPDQWSDVENISTGTNAIPVVARSAFVERYAWFRAQGVPAQLTQNQGAECLYVIISSMRGEGGNWKKVNEDFIGDTDNDNLLEFLDGWGRPIEFIRWPAGFPSDMQMGQPAPTSPNPPTARVENSSGVVEAATLDHDPFDPFRTDQYAYRLVPLIFSAGPDGVYDIAKPFLNYSNNTDVANRWNPYYQFEYKYEVNKTQVTRYKRMGEPLDLNDDGVENWHDNIHNHLISTR